MFVGREHELSSLEKLYKSDKFQFPVIYGRRRVGKTYLLREFSKGKKTIYFTGIESDSSSNLTNLSKSIFSGLSNDQSQNPDNLKEDALMPEDSTFLSYQAALEFVFKKSLDERIVFIIDEYPYLAKAEKSFASTLQMMIDNYQEKSKLFLILCGSSMSFMEEQVLGYQSPLYGRRTSQFKIRPFDIFECREYFKNYSDTDVALIYGIIGGTPHYLSKFDENLSVEENMEQNILDVNSYLFEEPVNLLKQEIRDAASYNAVLSAVSSGNTKLSQISGKTGDESGTCSAYLRKLISLEIVRKEIPVGSKSGKSSLKEKSEISSKILLSPSKKTIYITEDNLFRFWYRFVLPETSILENGMTNVVRRKISKQLPAYMGPVFEDICRQYLRKLNKTESLPFVFTEIGRWWGTDPEQKTETDIDIVATDGENLILGECKWTNEPIDKTILRTLISRERLVNTGHYKKVYYYLFSKNGFTDECIKEAENFGNVSMISFEEMMKISIKQKDWKN